jgi:3-oxoisoapionate kinase
MFQNLAPALDWLKSLGADFCHYKVCSTFDSSPTVGSIGRALEIGQDLFRQSKTPLVVGALDLPLESGGLF